MTTFEHYVENAARLYFCRNCGMLLDLELSDCKFCHVEIPSEQLSTKLKWRQEYESLSVRREAQRKEESSLPEGFDGRAIVEETCEVCGHDKARYFVQQTRSADEGQTVFYECCGCGHRKRVNA